MEEPFSDNITHEIDDLNGSYDIIRELCSSNITDQIDDLNGSYDIIRELCSSNITDQIDDLNGSYDIIREICSSNITDQIDDFYVDELYDQEPFSDEDYALLERLEKLEFQEIFFSATTGSAQPAKIATKDTGSSSSSQSQPFCKICMENVAADEVFQTSNACPHVFCRGCLSHYLGTKIQENISVVKCPDENCKVVLEPGMCQKLLPSEVFERWEKAFCESMLLGAQKLYCPFKDCSVLMMDDGEETVTCSECPSCRRLFCAACKVAWHSGLSCEEFGKLGKDERAKEDLLMMQLANEKEWRRCPSCKYFVEKTDGCLHITCR
ncbi:putative E3 ubiquitin-protein ligase RNF144A [Carex littledalei]|uniref:RBR-type E3 ubiquitin transferase n=1 Tax=Carex littledalei TaxID=544730 RepID=A0A833RTR9_9POAL|nr:putative E3 ubiquitin-protein ligase RNF144A [Carex littledalei]